MGFIFELIFESRVPEYVRYPLLAVISSFFVFVIGVSVFEGISLLRDDRISGLFFICAGLFLLTMCIKKFREHIP